MKIKNEYLKNNFIPLAFSILGSEIIVSCYYNEFNLLWFLIRALMVTFYIDIFKKIDGSREKKIIKYVILGGAVLVISLISIKILSLNSESIYSVISGGSLLDKKYELSISILLCLILSYVLYILIFKFIRREVVFLLFIFLMALYLKSNCINSIFIYIFIISFFILLCMNVENKLNGSIIIILSMFILALVIPVPKELPQLSMFKGIKDIINPQKYKLTLDGGSTPTYVSREEASDKVLYTFTGDNPTYFISECYDNIANNEWNKVDTALFNGKLLNEDDSYLESRNTTLKKCIDLLDNSYSEEINEIKKANDEKAEEGRVEVLDKNNDITSSEYTYIHPSMPKEYTFSYKKESFNINGFDRIYGNDLGETSQTKKNDKVNIDTSKDESNYAMAYTCEIPKYDSKDYYIMKYMNKKKYVAIEEYLRGKITDDKEYMDSLKTKEGLEKLFNSFYKDVLKDNREYVLGTSAYLDDNTRKEFFLYDGKLKYRICKSEYNGTYNEEKVMYVSGDDSTNEDFRELYLNFETLDGSIQEGDFYKEFYAMLMADYYGIETIKSLYSNTEYEDFYMDASKATVRMKELALNLTEGKDSTYYKAKAIENYFKSGDFKYSFDVSRTNSENPIDYFIFEGKKGYCIQYATAMVLLCRSLDIPARYVEGYYVTEADKVGDTYEIKEKNAHAFVQVYIYGYGWKIFDPTPGFYSGDDERENIEVLSNNNGDYSDIFIYGLLIVIVAVLSIYIYLKLTYRKRKIKNILKCSNEEALEKLIAYSIELIKYCNITYEAGETEMEFACKVDKLLNINFKECMDKYYAYKYGSCNVIAEDIIYALKVNNEVYKYKKQMRKNGGV